MNPSDIPPELLALQQQAARQVMAAVLVSLSFILSVFSCLFVVLGWRRVALVGMAVYGFIIFWVPSSITLICGPLIFVAAVGALVLEFVRWRNEQAPPQS